MINVDDDNDDDCHAYDEVITKIDDHDVMMMIMINVDDDNDDDCHVYEEVITKIDDHDVMMMMMMMMI